MLGAWRHVVKDPGVATRVGGDVIIQTLPGFTDLVDVFQRYVCAVRNIEIVSYQYVSIVNQLKIYDHDIERYNSYQ